MKLPVVQVGVSLGSLGPIILVFLILPGLVFVKTYMYASDRADTLSRLDKIGVVLVGGVLSAFVLAGVQLIAWPPSIRVTGLKNISVLVGTSAVVIQSFIGGVLGATLGHIDHTRWQTDRPMNFNEREQPWEYTAGEIRDEEVTIYTTLNNEPIRGIVARTRSGAEGGSIVLSPLDMDNREGTGNMSDAEENNAVFIDDSEISHIYFRDGEDEDEYSDLLTKGDLEPEEEEETMFPSRKHPFNPNK